MTCTNVACTPYQGHRSPPMVLLLAHLLYLTGVVYCYWSRHISHLVFVDSLSPNWNMSLLHVVCVNCVIAADR